METPEIRVIDGQSYLPIASESEGGNVTQRSPKKLESDSNQADLGAKSLAKELFKAIVNENEKGKASYYQALAAEFLGTFILTFVVCGLGIHMQDTPEIPALVGALGGGLTLATMVWVTGGISGGNLNPAISIALMLTGELNFIKAGLYIVSQIIGGILGTALLKALIPQDLHSQIAVTLVNENVPLINAFFIEFVITFVLALTVFACIDSTRTDLGGSAPLTIGLSVTVGALFGGKFTGGSMNPARSFGPAVIQNIWENHWVYWLGPIAGAIVAGVVYKVILKQRKQK